MTTTEGVDIPKLPLPIHYRVDGGFLWVLMGASEVWTKAYSLYGGTSVSVLNQSFGANPQIYKQFGLLGHNGLDFYAQTGTGLYAPCDGVITDAVIDDVQGYGHYIRMRSEMNGVNFELTFGHLKDEFVKQNDNVKANQLIAICDNTGFSTGSHLHFGFRLLDKSLAVLNYDNGYFGSLDPTSVLSPLVIQDTGELEKLYNYATAMGSPYGYYLGFGGSDRLLAACLKLGIQGRITQSQYYGYVLLRRK